MKLEPDEVIEVLKDFSKQVTVKSDGAYQTDKGMFACRAAIKALKKQIPKKPRNERRSVPLSRTSVRFVDWYKCGKCNSDLSRQFVCCPYCQSVIDWSEEE